MRRGVPSTFLGALGALGLSVACVSPPEVKNLPHIEARFGEPAPKKPEKAAPKSEPPSKPPERSVDPPPHRTRDFVKVSFKFESGRSTWLNSEPLRLAEETVAARRYGRFALIALEKGVLVERVYFDFPLLAKTTSSKNADVLESGLTTKATVLFPDLSAQAELFLVDEKTETREAVPWRSAAPDGDRAEPSAPAPTPAASDEKK